MHLCSHQHFYIITNFQHVDIQLWNNCHISEFLRFLFPLLPMNQNSVKNSPCKAIQLNKIRFKWFPFHLLRVDSTVVFQNKANTTKARTWLSSLWSDGSLVSKISSAVLRKNSVMPSPLCLGFRDWGLFCRSQDEWPYSLVSHLKVLYSQCKHSFQKLGSSSWWPADVSLSRFSEQKIFKTTVDSEMSSHQASRCMDDLPTALLLASAPFLS